MKKILLSATALSLALTASAFAADLPINKGPAIIPPPPPPTWTGFYVGLNAGGTFSNSQSITIVSSPIADFPNPATGVSWAGMAAFGATGILPAGSNGGFIGGGQIGYNYQFDAGRFGSSWLIGLEADIQGVASSKSTASAFSEVGPFPFVGASEVHTTSISSSRSLDYIGTVRGRLGFLVSPILLVYGTGGLAYGGVSGSTSIAQFNNDCSATPVPGACVQPAAATSGSHSNTLVGWTAGGGLEWMFLPNWSAKVEYLYYDLGTTTWGNGALAYNSGSLVAASGSAAVIASQSRAHFNGNIVRAGVNYHFNWFAPAAVLAKY
ncbi:outer membrane protein [Methylocystis bryophila]|uniref:Outer-membrane immunogenic protein n=1 Tax=Methylocystis bryophila TaxID=655015 RepID=A0A1W6MU71_9HYPH|nr:outer membrane beta-barrel protein [Methylocystis bryophila]ARN81107.1 outer-membrane immunogenic protein precursor [Methylocystis bryophila]BDV37035.1 outer-membrane immunogenic protein [Methylocystis bryophila]